MADMTKIWYFLPMRRVVFIAYPGFELLDVSGPIAVFNNANREVAMSGKSRFYGIELASSSGGLIESSSGIEVDTQSVGDIGSKAIDTLLIAGAEREPLLQAMADEAIRAALPRMARKARRFGSVCTGAFVLAAVGLIGDRRVTTHWDGCAPLAEAFPSVSVDPDALYVEDGQLWTSAGVTTGIDMALAMVAHDLGAAIAGEVAKRLVLYARRPGFQSQFSPLLRAQAKADNPFAELIGWIQANLEAPLDVVTLATRAGLSERTFHRRFVAVTGETPARFVEKARLDGARMLLSRGGSLKSVAAQVGLFPATRFSEAFERRFGISPRLFREMHAEL